MSGILAPLGLVLTVLGLVQQITGTAVVEVQNLILAGLVFAVAAHGRWDA